MQCSRDVSTILAKQVVPLKVVRPNQIFTHLTLACHADLAGIAASAAVLAPWGTRRGHSASSCPTRAALGEHTFIDFTTTHYCPVPLLPGVSIHPLAFYPQCVTERRRRIY